MRVNFKGLKNLGALNGLDNEKIVASVTAKLTNDQNGNDLEEFRELLNAFPNKMDKDTVTICIEEYVPDAETPENIEEIDNRKVFINDKELKFNIKNIPVFAKTKNLLEKISNNNIPNHVDKQLINSCDGFDIFSPNGRFYPVYALLNTHFGELSQKAAENLLFEMESDNFKIANIYASYLAKDEAIYLNKTLDKELSKHF